MKRDQDVIIAGGGPSGLACALSLSRDGRRVAVVERASEAKLRTPAFDGREIALTHHSVAWLREIGVWEHIPAQAIASLRQARILNGHNLERADKTSLFFEPPKGGPQALGYLVSNHLIRAALYHVAQASRRISFHLATEIHETCGKRGHAEMVLSSGDTLTGKLIVAADGRFSRIREQRGIGAFVHDFKSSILVCRVRHPLAHDDIAVQWFDEGQTIAFLPVATDGGPGYLSSLVLTLPPDEIERLCRLDDDAFNQEISHRSQGRMGGLHVESPRCVYPLKTVYAHRFNSERLALIGDAAVGMHPITAHGFNFGLRAQELLTRSIANGSGDAGDAGALRRYTWELRRATAPLFAVTNGIATLFTRDRLAERVLRQGTVHLVNRLSPIRRIAASLLMDREPHEAHAQDATMV